MRNHPVCRVMIIKWSLFRQVHSKDELPVCVNNKYSSQHGCAAKHKTPQRRNRTSRQIPDQRINTPKRRRTAGQQRNPSSSSTRSSHSISSTKVSPESPENSLIASILLFNIQGMNPGILNQKWKTLSLEELITSTPNYIPFVIITETHLKPDIFDAEIQIKNYNLQRADRLANRKGGGVSVYSHDSIAISCVETFSDKHCQAVLLYNETHNVIVVGVYRPPDTPLVSFTNLMIKIQDFINKYNNPDIIIQGDLNFPNVVWCNSAIKSGKSTEDNKSAQLLLDFMDKNFMTQHVEENTRDDKNILDVIIMNNDEHLHNITVEKCKITSDHDLVKCDLLNLFKKPTVTKAPYKPTSEFDKWNWNKANWDSIREDKVDWEQMMNN